MPSGAKSSFTQNGSSESLGVSVGASTPAGSSTLTVTGTSGSLSHSATATLVVNSVIVGVSFMAYALFTKATPIWLIYAVLLFGGFFRSLQFTSLNGLAFADIDQPVMSRASTMSTMGQQLAQSFGIGMAAMLLHLFAARCNQVFDQICGWRFAQKRDDYLGWFLAGEGIVAED